MENAKDSWTDVEDRGPGSSICPLRVPREEREGEKGREGGKEKEKILNKSRGKRLIGEIFGLPCDSDLVSMAQFLWMSEAQYLLRQYT